MIIAIDHGNYAIKTINHSFVAGLSEHTVKPPMTDEIMEYNGRFWTLTGNRLSYMRELESAGRLSAFETIDLAVGLPPEHYGILKNRFAQYFKRTGTINFVYKDSPVSIIIRNVCVYPQAYAAVVPHAGKLLSTLLMFIVDIGGYTTDVLLLRKGKPDLQFCRSLELGVITMNNDIIRKVGALHDMKIEDEHISAVLRGEETFLPEDVIETIKKATETHTRDILYKLRELQVDLRANPAMFVGGGSILFEEYIKASNLVSKAEFIEDPKANAIGYQMLASKQLGHRPIV